MNRPLRTEITRLDHLLDKVKQRGNGGNLPAGSEDKTLSKDKLPFFRIGALPNHINRSSLIAPIGRAQRKFLHNSSLVSRQDCKIEYTGEQLDEADGDILMALLYFGRSSCTGEAVFVNRSQILKLIHRGTGGKQYDWLESRMNAIATSTLSITTKYYEVGRKSVFHIISSYELDQKSGDYKYKLDAEWVILFSRSEFSLLNWERRMLINHRFTIAKALQRLVSTDKSRTQKYNIQSLKEQFVYRSNRRDFLASLSKNLEALKTVGLVNTAEIGRSSKGDLQLVLTLPDNQFT